MNLQIWKIFDDAYGFELGVDWDSWVACTDFAEIPKLIIFLKEYFSLDGLFVFFEIDFGLVDAKHIGFEFVNEIY